MIPTDQLVAYRSDVEVIQQHMRETAAVAEAIRRQTANLELVDLEPVQNSALSWPESPRERVQHVTVRPVEEIQPARHMGWWARHWPQVAITLGVLAAAGVGLWLLVLAIAAAFAALAAALAAAVPVLAVVAVVVVLLALLGGGKAVSACAGLHCGGCGK